jgi:hypothetical protein
VADWLKRTAMVLHDIRTRLRTVARLKWSRLITTKWVACLVSNHFIGLKPTLPSVRQVWLNR